MTDVTLRDLVGMRTLTGIWRGMRTAPLNVYGEDATVVVIEIDGKLYEFSEDHSDGYRSMLESVRVLACEDFEESLALIHPPVVVEFRERCTCYVAWVQGTPVVHEHVEFVYGVDERSGLVVIEIGTDHSDDYYPSFVFDWNPAGSTPKWLEATP